MDRLIRYLIAGALAAGLALGSTPAQATRDFTPAKRHEFCRYQSANHQRGYQYGEVNTLIRCLVDHYPVEGGYAKAHYIAERESGLYCHAHNPTSSATGLFQIVAGTWDSWWSALSPALGRWRIHDNPNFCRANAVVGIVAAHRWGWAPWGG